MLLTRHSSDSTYIYRYRDWEVLVSCAIAIRPPRSVRVVGLSGLSGAHATRPFLPANKGLDQGFWSLDSSGRVLFDGRMIGRTVRTPLLLGSCARQRLHDSLANDFRYRVWL